MKLRLTIAIASALSVSCVHETRVAAVQGPPQPTVWDRQIRNATDAGDGDYALKTLRARVEAEPDNVSARLELATLYRDRGFPEIGLDVCRLTVARFPESAEAQLGLVRALFELKRFRDAIA